MNRGMHLRSLRVTTDTLFNLWHGSRYKSYNDYADQNTKPRKNTSKQLVGGVQFLFPDSLREWIVTPSPLREATSRMEELVLLREQLPRTGVLCTDAFMSRKHMDIKSDQGDNTLLLSFPAPNTKVMTISGA